MRMPSGEGAAVAEALVSVVIPTYNRAAYLGEAIESVLNQRYRHLEVIVIDDGSTDDTPAVVARYAGAIRYAWQPNSERGAARNHGLRLARGEFIAFLDSDDLWTPDKLDWDLDLLRRRVDCGVVYSDTLSVDAAKRPQRRIRRRGGEGQVTVFLLHQNFVSMGAHLVRTQIMREAGGFHEERDLAEDWEAWVRVSTRTSFGYVPRPTTLRRIHPGNSVGDVATVERATHRACALMGASTYLNAAQRRHLPCALGEAALLCAIHHRAAGNRAAARAWLLRAVRRSPRLVGSWRFHYTAVNSLLPPAMSGTMRLAAHRLLDMCRRSDP
jgi:glycosyl transferase family 2